MATNSRIVPPADVDLDRVTSTAPPVPGWSPHSDADAQPGPTAHPIGDHGIDHPTVLMACWPIDGEGRARTFEALPSQRAAVGVGTVGIDAGFVATRRLPQPANLDDVREFAGIMLTDCGWLQCSPWRGHADREGVQMSAWLHPELTVDRDTGTLVGPLHAPVSDPVGGLGDASVPDVVLGS